MSTERNWFKQIVNLRGSVIVGIWQRVVVNMAFAALITLFYQQGWVQLHQPSLTILVPGVVLGLLIVFRTNTAYERFWEGRKAFGAVIDGIRFLSRQVETNVPERSAKDIDDKVRFNRMLIGFFHASILQMRKQAPNQQLKTYLPDELWPRVSHAVNPPLVIAKSIGTYLNQWYTEGYIDSIQLMAYNSSVDRMVEYFGSCERIAGTPMPAAYSIHLRHLLFFYCFALPFQIVGEIQWMTPLAVGIISFAIMGIEEIGIEIEHPFGYDANDIDLETLLYETQREVEQDSELLVRQSSSVTV